MRRVASRCHGGGLRGHPPAGACSATFTWPKTHGIGIRQVSGDAAARAGARPDAGVGWPARTVHVAPHRHAGQGDAIGLAQVAAHAAARHGP